MDPCVGHAERIVLSNRNLDEYHVSRPTLREIDLIRQHGEEIGDPIYKHPFIPGYEGFVPRINGKFGQRFLIEATEGLADLEREAMRNRCKLRKMKHRGALQSSATGSRSLGERSVCNKYCIHNIYE